MIAFLWDMNAECAFFFPKYYKRAKTTVKYRLMNATHEFANTVLTFSIAFNYVWIRIK